MRVCAMLSCNLDCGRRLAPDVRGLQIWEGSAEDWVEEHCFTELYDKLCTHECTHSVAMSRHRPEVI